MFSKLHRNRTKTNSGFSLIEVLVTSAIIGILTAVVVIRYGAFNSTILLKNQAYELALAYREAQVSSISTRGESNVPDITKQFRHPYGIAINMNKKQEIVLFLDVAADGVYDPTSTDIEVEVLTLDSRFEIEKICANTACSDSPTNKINKLAVIFKRPDFDAQIQPSNSAGKLGSGYTEAVITLNSVDSINIQRTVTVSSTGQISVQ